MKAVTTMTFCNLKAVTLTVKINRANDHYYTKKKKLKHFIFFQITLKPNPVHTITESSTSTAKKRNPYSIEELLKKPEKRIKLEPIILTPSNEILKSSPHQFCESSKDGNEQDEDTLSEKNFHVEVCD